LSKILLKVRILGCGPSCGVPSPSGVWANCDSLNSKNIRLRSSVLVRYDDRNVLIDTSPDLRQQALAANLKKVDAVLYTHPHSDHMGGCSELSSLREVHYGANHDYNVHQVKKSIDLYANKYTSDQLHQSFGYMINDATVKINEIPNQGEINLFNMHVRFFPQDHDVCTTLGFVLDHKLAYSTDVIRIDDEHLYSLRGIDTWIVACLSQSYCAKKHANFERVMEWQKIVQAKNVILTHMSGDMDYKIMSERCPKNVRLGYDELEFDIS
jgi:phosphoribosyl 1,2-cyclic phosphate phosphodiesterase